MFTDKVFRISLLISFIAHGIFLTYNYGTNLLPRQVKKEKLEVAYLKDVLKEPAPKETQSAKKEPFLKLTPKVTAEKKVPPPFIDKENIFKEEKRIELHRSALLKPKQSLPDIIAIKKKITLPPIGIENIKNPSYINYYQLVREKIRRSAYQNYTRTDVGEVYVSFIISDKGELNELKVIEDKSSLNPYLKETALASVRDASPFPAFPKELDYPQLTFNVIISFEIE